LRCLYIRILAVTGTLAAPILRDVASRVRKHRVDVLVTPIPVAAFITPEYVVSVILERGINVRDYDLIMLPGLSRGSARIIEERLGVRAVKGTINAYDLVDLLENVDPAILSPDEPADKVVGDLFRGSAVKILSGLELKACDRGCVVVGDVAVPSVPPPIRVASEIPEASRRSVDEVVDEVGRRLNFGADIVVLEFSYETDPETVRRIVGAVKERFSAPVGIDAYRLSEIIAGVDAGADIVVNVGLSTAEKIDEVLRDVAVVAVPLTDGWLPNSVADRALIAERTVQTLRSRGVEKIVVDLVLDSPPNLFASLLGYYEFKKKYPEIPLAANVDNVVEMVDADSIGINALLTLLAQEVGVSMLLTAERNPRSTGSTLELKASSQLAALSHTKGFPPRDLGVELFVVKDRSRYDVEFSEDELKGAQIVDASGARVEHQLDPMGIFKIRVNHSEGVIEALYIGRKGKMLIKAPDARSIRDYIISNGLVTQLSHAFYLGAELSKAEEALRAGRSYVQELPLLRKIRFIRL